MSEKQSRKKPKPKPAGKKPPAKRAAPVTAKRVQAEDRRPLTIPVVTIKPEEDLDPIGDDGLTPRQREFVAAYVGPAAMNGRRAALMAGYSPDNINAAAVTACRLLNNANVQEAVSLALARKRMSPEWTKAQIVDLARSSMANFGEVGPDGKFVIDYAKARDAAAIGHIKEIQEEVIEMEGMPSVLKRKIKLYDRQSALRLLAEIQGLQTPAPQAAKTPEDLFFQTSGQLADAMPDGVVPDMPDDIATAPRVAGGDDA